MHSGWHAGRRRLRARNGRNAAESLSPRQERKDRTDPTFTTAWQVIEARYEAGISDGSEDDPVTDVRRQYVWGTRYIDGLVCRDEDVSDGSGGIDDGGCVGGVS